MRHHYFGKKLSRTKNERKTLFRGLLRNFILHGTMRTTMAKAKAVQPLIEKLITKAKLGTEQKKSQAMAIVVDKQVVDRLWQVAASFPAHRSNGFTRIIKLGPRSGDATEEVLLSFVDMPLASKTPSEGQITPKLDTSANMDGKSVRKTQLQKRDKRGTHKK